MPATRTVGAYEAKTTLPALLEFVAQGHDVIITKHERQSSSNPPSDPAKGNRRNNCAE
jgi:hypothetical protein